jgi:hypothetical protein
VANEHAAANSEPQSLTHSPRHPGTPARAALLFLTLALTLAPAALAADPTPDPAATIRPPTCAERFPSEGPAGVDLRLGCIVGEVVGVYTPGQPELPVPMSSYAIAVVLFVIGILIVILFTGRFLHWLAARSIGRRLAPVLPGEWWVCASCKSVNGANAGRCYSCGAGRPDGPALMTDDQPNIPQSFGRKRKSG